MQQSRSLRVWRLRMLLALAIAAVWPGICSASDAPLQDDINTLLLDEGLTGIAWTLINDDGAVSFGAAGTQDSSTGKPFAADTRFHVGSLTKTVLATGILRLSTEGRIELEAPVLRYLPDLFSESHPPGFASVTVRHLLDHTAGLNDAHLWQMFSERSTPDSPLIAAFPNPTTQLNVRAQPGSTFSYSNMGYTLLGMVIESVVGSRYENYLDEFVLAPLEMRDSTFAFTTQVGANADARLAWGHIDDGSRYAAVPIFLRPAGQFTTTTADLAHFAKFLMSDGTVNGQVFIDRSMMGARGKPFATDAAVAGLEAGYALGLGRRDRHDVVAYCHSGNIVGFMAMLCVFPEAGKAFAYSVNTDNETASYGRFDARFIAALNIADATSPETVSGSIDNADWLGRYVLRPNRFQMFAYLDTVFGAIRVSAEDDLLTISSLQRRPRQLRPVGQNRYVASDRTTTSHVLFKNEQGALLLSDGFSTYRKVPSAFLFAHWMSVILGLAGIVWILIAGLLSLVRYRLKFLQRSVAPSFVAAASLFMPIPFFMSQSFMALGDMTAGSVLLAAATGFLPFGMLLTIWLAIKERDAATMTRVHAIAALFVLQWCVVLAANETLPFRLWA